MIKAGKLKAELFAGSYMVNARDLAKVKERKPGRPRTNTLTGSTLRSAELKSNR